jgi:predicted TPR repeat methyltransferase
MNCRHCNQILSNTFIDLSTAPPSNAYVSEEKLNDIEKWYPLRVMVCDRCWLVQTQDFANANELFDSQYAYFSSMSSHWLQHAEKYVNQSIKRFNLDANSHVVEIASNDGYLLQYMQKAGIPCTGIEPTKSTALAAKDKGLNVIIDFFSVKLSKKLLDDGLQSDLIAANNVLAHVPDINDFVRGVSILLKDTGVATFEFPHLVKLIDNCQFDTIYHEHFSYLSLHAVNTIFKANGLTIFDVQEIPTHGGSLRVFAGKSGVMHHEIMPSVEILLQSEFKKGITSLQLYKEFQSRSEVIKYTFLEFLLEAKRQEKKVAGYGAAAKGNTLMNFSGVRSDLVSFVVDRSPGKQGKYTPGGRIPIVGEDKIKETMPDFIIIFPWNIESEIKEQISYIGDWGGKFVTFIPHLKIT